jgi:tripartite-type tricarboxylate transporter receptor subunit TctC
MPTRRDLGALALASLAAPALAQPAWPDRPLRVVVPYAPGGGADVVARALWQKLGEILGQACVIENRGGGAGIIGASLVAQATPDGYTFLHDATALSVNPALFEGRLPFDTLRAFRPVFLAGTLPNLLLATLGVPQRNVAEVIALARTTPEGINWASGGNGGIQHLAIEMFSRMAGVKLNHVPYKGGAASITDVIAGNVKFGFSNAATANAQVRSGLVRPIAHTALGRMASLPELPAVAETLPGFEALEWNAVFAPARVADGIIQRLNEGLNQALADARVQDRLAAVSLQMRPNTPEDTASFFAAELAKWSQLVREAGIRPE